MRKKFFKSAFAVSLISLSILPLTTSSAWGRDTTSQQQKQSVIIATANKSRIAQLINKLEEKYTSLSPEAGEDASRELVKIGKPAVPQLIEAFKQNRLLLNFGISETLSQIAKKDASVKQIMIDKLGDKNPQIRLGAMFALSDSSFQTALMKAAQNHRNPRVRSYAILFINEAGSSAIPIYKAALNDVDPTVRKNAAMALASKNKKSAEYIAVLKNGLKDNDSLIRIVSAKTLLDNDSEINDATSVLVKELKNKNAIIRLYAVQSLIKVNQTNPQVLPEILNAIDNNDLGIRIMVIDAISKLGNQKKAAVPTLIKATSDKNEIVRINAIGELGKMGFDAKAAQPKLLAILRNKQEDYIIRNIAASALQEIDSLALIPMLTNSLSQKDLDNNIYLYYLTDTASKVKVNKDSYSQAELTKAIDEFETALKVIDNSNNNFSEFEIESLRESVAVLKGSKK